MLYLGKERHTLLAFLGNSRLGKNYCGPQSRDSR